MGQHESNLEANQSSGIPARSSRNKTRRKGMHPFFAFILTLLLIAIIGVALYFTYLYMQLDDTLSEISGEEPAAEIPREERASQKPMVLLLLGLDTREATRSLNTDVIMAIALNPKTKQASVVSVPRDLYMQPDGYKARKANAFYSISRGNGKDKPGGPDGLVKSMFGELLGVPIDYLTVINFKTFEDVIDAIGGIEVDVDMNMCYIDNADGTNIQLTKGVQVLNGPDALGFVRYRHSTSKCGKGRTAESSDIERNMRQQAVIAAMLDKVTSVGGLLKLDEIFKAVGSNVESDIPKSQLRSFLTTYATINKSDVEFLSLVGDWRSPYIRVSDENMDAVKQKLKERLAGVQTVNAGTP
jgi:polyisoprenyl-teichoic acid--peptidoglycan teichoic acid transferase